MKTLEDIINTGIIHALERTQDLMGVLASQLLSDEKGVSAGSYVALMALWRQIDPTAAREGDVDCVRGADGRHRLMEDSLLRPDEPDYRVDVTTPA